VVNVRKWSPGTAPQVSVEGGVARSRAWAAERGVAPGRGVDAGRGVKERLTGFRVPVRGRPDYRGYAGGQTIQQLGDGEGFRTQYGLWQQLPAAPERCWVHAGLASPL
jgi:hypothetical protein